ncbi:hypothetical protein [Winogradskyella luteola]|uniref:Uncharacterized protein n=1 Tax=Winogradskyella luteola TaxID=2828330 RepID=A0A9X1F8L8_9FLAO|nr:hypothetical protein [Winogradskyella luteola]MBV7268618.1 hypothetical protein [Winogradskyella luteola]
MMSNPEIDKKVKATLDAIETIEDVRVSSFLKDRILASTNNTDTVEMDNLWSWFTPSLQFIILVVFMVLNIYTCINLDAEDYNASVDEFIEAYNLVEDNGSTIF